MTAGLPVGAREGRSAVGRWLALPTLLLVLAGVIQATRVLVAAPNLAPVGGKLARAERAMVYELTPEGGPRFRLAGGAEVLQLLVHLEVPPGGAAEAVYRFGISATLRGPDGAELWARTVTQRTRRTKEGDYEGAFVVDGRVELSDSASVELALPDAPPGAALELRLTGDSGALVGEAVQAFARPTALMRAYRRQSVDPAQRELRRLALASRERRLPETYLPWFALAADQQEQRLATAWERLAAEGRAGVDYRVRSIYVAPPRPPPAPPVRAPTLMLADGQPLVVQLQGPGVVWVDARATAPEAVGTLRAQLWAVPVVDAGGAGPVRDERVGDRSGGAGLGDRSGGAGPVRDERVGDRAVAGGGDRAVAEAAGPVAVSDGAADLGDMSPAGARAAEEVVLAPSGRAEISVPAGWWSLELATDLPAVQVQVRADSAERHAGADDHATHGDAAGWAPAEGMRALVPVDVRQLSMYALGPGIPALPVALSPGEEPEARFVRVEVRACILAPVTIHYSFVDAAGAVLAGGDHVVDTTRPAPFERLRAVGGDVPEDMPGADGEAAGPLVFPLAAEPVSEAETFGLIAPAGAVRVTLSASSAALVAVHGRLAASRDDAAAGRWAWPYGQVDEGLARWRFAPPLRPRSFPRRAEDHAARSAAGQVRTIAAQVRVAAPTETERTEGPWRAEQPRGSHTRLRLLEEVPAARRKAALAAWGPGSYTRLRAGVPVTLDLTRGAPRPATLRYQVTGSAMDVVGTSLFVTIDGQGSRWPVTTRAGRRTLARKASTEVIWSGSGSVALLVNRPPTSGAAALYEHRQVHQLSAGGLGVTLTKPSAAPVGLNVVVYWIDGPPRAPTELVIEVDEGTPGRRRGTPVSGVFAARRTVAVTPSRVAGAIFPDRRGESEVAIGRAAVVLGDDVAPGKHTVRVRHAGGPAVWVRFFEAGEPEARTRAWQWSERRGAAVEEADEDE